MTGPAKRGPRSELRILRLCTGVVGASTLAATVATSVVIARPNQLAVSTPSLLLTAIAMVLPVLAAGIARWSSIRTLRRLNALVVIEYGVLVLALPLAAATGQPSAAEVPWALTFTAVPVAAALVAWGRRVAWLVLLAATCAIQLLRLLVAHDTASALASDVQAFFASLTLLLLFGTLIEASREFDRSTLVAHARASRRSEEDARADVRRRLQALVHDELLATLVLAARDVPSLRTAVASQAARVRRLLRDLHEPETTERVPPEELVRQLHEAVAHDAPEAEFRITDDRHAGAAGPPVGFDTAEALTGALRQALVNSRNHAGPDASLSVDITIAGDGLEIVVADDGVGFDPAHVPSRRLGISTSIVGRLRGIPGGDARVESRPGTGTRVTLSWTPAVGPAIAESRSADGPAVLPAADRRIHCGLLAAIAVFWIAQTGLAALAGTVAGEPWVAVLAVSGVGLALVAIGWTSLARPGPARAWLVVALVVATTALSLVPIPRDTQRYGDTWYVAACGFVLLVLAVRGRPGLAAVGGLLAVGLALIGARGWPNDVADVAASATRHTVILAIGVPLVLGITRTWARIAALRAEELAAVRAQAFGEAAGRELVERTRTLQDVIGRILERLESGAELTADERNDCAALDGRLRDQYRGGRISRPPLIDAAMAARRRGVDVVLLDDAADRTLPEGDLDAIARWLAAQLETVPTGRFTGRLLPSGRGGLASAVVGDDVLELHQVP